ncbi:DUF7289 family protein [Methanolobus halotolerans]|uniref:Uncharacterized protein n=1 Tax=Methanolobus halotolerans TaxID=2052935 RepID=A0A4E0QX96_9EURY|nr:hypothetical protein [Methanolobus halotolerans]TGC07299.1 hypothetical protein CUN85_11640 [Methanolobus halotolerans]
MDSRKKKGKSIVESEDALSEVLGFSLTLGLMVLALAVIGVAGYPMLDQMQERGHLLNIEQSFSVLQPNINKVAYGKAPSQSVELKMYGSQVSATGTSYMNMSMQAWNSTSSDYDTPSLERQMRKIENQYGENFIAYENTGVWARYPQGGSVIISKPDFAYHDNVLLVPMVTISGSKSVSGTGLTRVISQGGQTSVSVYENVSAVTITLTSDYYESWGRYLNETLEMDINNVDSGNNTISASRNYNPGIDVIVTLSPMSVTIE